MKSISEFRDEISTGIYKSIDKFVDTKDNVKKTFFVLDDQSYNILKKYINNNFNLSNIKILESFYIEVTNLKFGNNLKVQTDLSQDVIIKNYFFNNKILLFKLDGLINYNDNYLIAAIQDDYILDKNKIFWKNMKELSLKGFYIEK